MTAAVETSSWGMYSYEGNALTGNAYQPHSLTVFTQGSNHLSYVQTDYIPQPDCMGLFPLVSTFTALPRIKSAVDKIFYELAEPVPNIDEIRIGFENIGRGLMELIPLIGNLALLIFDSIVLVAHEENIKASICQEHNIVGVAIEGQIAFTIPHERVRAIIRARNNATLQELHANFAYFCTEYVKRRAESPQPKLPMAQIMQIFSSAIMARYAQVIAVP